MIRLPVINSHSQLSKFSKFVVVFTLTSIFSSIDVLADSGQISYSASGSTVSIPYYQDFSSGKPDRSGGWEYYSDNEGRIEVVDGQLRMDDWQDGSAYSLNEAILHLNLNGRSGVILTLDHLDNSDETDFLPANFIGHYNGDGIAISADGTNWYLLANLTTSFDDQSFDIDAAIKAACISYTSDFCIKFQQYDNYSWENDGRAFDNITVTATGADPGFRRPFGTWKGTFNSTSYNTSGTITNWIMREDYTTESRWELNVTEDTGIKINASGTYTFNSANDRLEYIYSGVATTWASGQVATVPCILSVSGTAFRDNASGNYEIKLYPPNLPQVTDSGTWQINKIPTISTHISEIEMCVGNNYHDPSAWNDTTYDFCLGLETDSTVSSVQFLSPGGFTFQIPADANTQLGEIQTWHYSLGAAPFNILSTGLVANWKMDDNAANTTVTDSSGKGNNGTAQRNTSALATTGVIDGALSFNGSNDYINCGNNSSLDITGSVSISAWVKFNSLPNYQTLIAKRGAVTDATSNYAFRTGALSNKNQLEFYYHNGQQWQVYTTSNANITTGQWYHVVVTYKFGSGTSIICYLNNNLLNGNWTLGNGNSSVRTNTKPVTIGGLTNGERLNGAIDNVIMFNRILTDGEIKALYEKNRERWEYIGNFTSENSLTRYNNGNYIITAYYKDGSQAQTIARFGIPQTTNAIPQPSQEPLLTFPNHNGVTYSPVTFKWLPCYDENVKSIDLSLENQDNNESLDVELAVNATSSNQIPLSRGTWQAKIFFDNWYDFNNTEGISIHVGK
jgi:hypothetical protein